MDNQIIFGVTDEQSGYKDEILLTNMSNRHGCITGATGTGKTVSLQTRVWQIPANKKLSTL